MKRSVDFVKCLKVDLCHLSLEIWNKFINRDYAIELLLPQSARNRPRRRC